MKILGFNEQAGYEYELILTKNRLTQNGNRDWCKGRFILLSDLRAVRDIPKYCTYGNVDMVYDDKTTITGRFAKLLEPKSNKTAIKNRNQLGGLVFVQLTLSNDGTGQIGCTRFNAETMTKIVKAIFGSKLTLNNDGTGQIGCTEFDAPTMTKILKVIFGGK